MSGDWWFGFITGVGALLVVWAVKDAKLHRMGNSRRRSGLRRKGTRRSG